MNLPIHELKTWVDYFGAIWHGIKSFEIRRNDRNFKVEDLLLLQEYDHVLRRYTGRKIIAVITYILPGGQFGLEEGHVALGIKVLHQFSALDIEHPTITVPSKANI